MANKKMNKKIKIEIAVGIIVVLAIIVGAVVWKGSKEIKMETPKVAIERKPDIVACTEEAKLCSDGSYVSRTGPNCEFATCPEAFEELVRAGYKKVEVINPLVKFSFEVPEKWLTETRNASGQMTMQEKRDFLATNDGSKIGKEVWSDYVDYSLNDIKKMDDGAVNKLFQATNGQYRYPNASIAVDGVVGRIWYTDKNGDQIDFYIEKGSAEKKSIESKDSCESNYVKRTKGLEGSTINGKPWVLSKPVYTIKKGSNLIFYSNECDSEWSVGNTVYVEIPDSNYFLVIDQQARGDKNINEKFQNVLDTLKIL